VVRHQSLPSTAVTTRSSPSSRDAAGSLVQLPDDGYRTSSRFTRCTVPLPTPSCAAIVSMPTPAARRRRRFAEGFLHRHEGMGAAALRPEGEVSPLADRR